MTNVIDTQTNGIALLPCPFCGGEAKLETYPGAPEYFAIVRCLACGSRSVKDDDTEAIEAWNTRTHAQEIVLDATSLPKTFSLCDTISLHGETYMKERTCHKIIPNAENGYVFCSECGAEIGEYNVPNYCHMCGAKVADE